jgi:acyl-CoA synthetase (NDP forming)
VLVEALDDVALCPLPLTRSDAERTVRALRGRKILDGVRGRPPCDVAALVDAIVRLADAMREHDGAVVEVDVNPLVVRERGRGVVAVDALVVVRDGSAPA